jgi:hypothetical protein
MRALSHLVLGTPKPWRKMAELYIEIEKLSVIAKLLQPSATMCSEEIFEDCSD